MVDTSYRFKAGNELPEVQLPPEVIAEYERLVNAGKDAKAIALVNAAVEELRNAET